MAEKMKELESIMSLIKDKHNFLLSGGAGSGKTYTLVHVIRMVIKQYPYCSIACITYTNAAALEIQHRIEQHNLSVSTIHDFLWDNIKVYQKELRKAVIELINNPDENKFKILGVESVPSNYYTGEEIINISYKEYLSLKNGIISHDQVLVVANYLFEHYPKIAEIVKSKYDFIFVDEYQDTHEDVINILLKHLTQSKKNCVIGFFGDSMQSIYEDGIGDINDYLHKDEPENAGTVWEVRKEQNRRNPQRVINIANQLRTDGLEQAASEDKSAPNMTTDGVIDNGETKFLYSENDEYELAHSYLEDNFGWDFNDKYQTKELDLTYNLIASKAGFPKLLEIHTADKILDYKKQIVDFIKDHCPDADFSALNFGQVVEKLKSDYPDANSIKKLNPKGGQQEQYIKDNPGLFEYARSLNFDSFKTNHVMREQLTDDKTDEEEGYSSTGSNLSAVMKHLHKIELIMRLYDEENYNEFVRKTDFTLLKSKADKVALKQKMEQLKEASDGLIGAVIDKANELGLCKIDDRLNDYIDRNNYVYHRICETRYSEYKNVFDFISGLKPYSTQHKTKGLEFDNVLVLLDNGNWRNYNYATLFDDALGTSESVKIRTRKMFYVCCTRAKKQLAVYYPQPSDAVIAGAKRMFGEDNVVNLSSC